MKFEHLVQINDLHNPLVKNLSREQLWKGLVLRVESPTRFMPHLDKAELAEKTPGSVKRVLHYGKLQVADTVTYLPQQYIHIDVPEQGEITRSHMRMMIEEPGDGALFVRFIYEVADVQTEDGMQQMYEDYRRSAYVNADIEAIGIIRELIENQDGII